jgi:hypothetical protein
MSRKLRYLEVKFKENAIKASSIVKEFRIS